MSIAGMKVDDRRARLSKMVCEVVRSGRKTLAEDFALDLIEDLLFDTATLLSEVDRLKRGDFSVEEFQNLCHHRDEKPGCTKEDFAAGCREYQTKLFGAGGLE